MILQKKIKLKNILLVLLFFIYGAAYGQPKAVNASSNELPGLVERMKQFHQMMVKPKFLLGQYLDDSLSYGHSNGWVQNKTEFIADMGQKLTYHGFREDSISGKVNGRAASIRFIADIDVTMDGKRTNFHLKVLEVWVKKKKSWKLFARQAVK